MHVRALGHPHPQGAHLKDKAPLEAGEIVTWPIALRHGHVKGEREYRGRERESIERETGEISGVTSQAARSPAASGARPGTLRGLLGQFRAERTRV